MEKELEGRLNMIVIGISIIIGELFAIGIAIVIS